MLKIKKITGDSGKTFFKLADSTIIIADSEFRAKSGKIDGFIVYRDTMKFYESNTSLSSQEIDELVKQYEKYKIAYSDIVDWA